MLRKTELQSERCQTELSQLHEKIRKDNIVAASKEMLEIFNLANRASASGPG